MEAAVAVVIRVAVIVIGGMYPFDEIFIEWEKLFGASQLQIVIRERRTHFLLHKNLEKLDFAATLSEIFSARSAGFRALGNRWAFDFLLDFHADLEDINPSVEKSFRCFLVLHNGPADRVGAKVDT